MSAYEFFKDFAGPLATATAALAAAFVTGLFAYRQAKTAELQAEIALDKLKYETFEARHDVLDACRDLSAYCNGQVRTHGAIDRTTVEEYALRITMGKFYFGRQVCRSLDFHIRGAQVLASAQWPMRKGALQTPTPEADLALRDQAQEAFNRSAVLVDGLLEYDLSLNLLKRGSDRRHGLPEKLRRIRARRAFVRRVGRRLRRLVGLRRSDDLPTSAPPEVRP